MKKLKCLPALACAIGIVYFAMPAQAQTEIPGDSFAQKKVILTLQLLPRILQACWIDPGACALDPAEKQALIKISEVFPEKYSSASVAFVSEKDHPGLFEKGHGPHRLAVTGRKPGSVIYFNSEILESADIGFPALVSILFHELGHHVGFLDTSEAFLDVFGNKMARMFEKGARFTDAGSLGFPHLQLLIYQALGSQTDYERLGSPQVSLLPSVIMMDGKQISDLSGTFIHATDCYYGAQMNKLWAWGERWTGTLEIPRIGEKLIVAEVEENHLCESSGHKSLIKAIFRIQMGLKTDHQNVMRFSGKTGVSNPSTDWVESDVSPLLGALSRERFPSGGRLAVLEAKSLVNQLRAGETFSVDFEIESATNEPLRSCFVILSSSELESRYSSGEPYAFESNPEDCSLKKVGSKRYKGTAKYRFPEAAPPRNYHLKAIGAKSGVTFLAVYGQPKRRLQIELAGESKSGLERKASVRTVVGNYETSFATDSNTLTTAAPAPQVAKVAKVAKDMPYSWCSRFHLMVTMEGASPLIQSHLWYRIHYNTPVMRPVVIMERLTNNNYAYNWRISQTLEGVNSTIDHWISIKQEFLRPELFERVEFLRISLMTADLREKVIDFPEDHAGLSVIFPSRSCE